MNQDRHWKWMEKKEHDLSKMSRKTKKAAKQIYQLIGQPTREDMEYWRFQDFPDCRWCNGSGTYREHYNDSGYGCPDCYGSGKVGWEFNSKGEKVTIHK